MLLVMLTCGLCYAQNNSQETLTNAKVISMVKGALPKAIILTSIENKLSNFDTSTDAMIALKKQGVPDDIITAMVVKATKKIEPVPVQKVAKVEPVATTPKVKAEPFNPVSTKDCKFIKVKTMDGGTTSVIEASGKLGNFLIGKSNGQITLSYNTKALLSFFAQDTKNLAHLRIDSVQFLFADNSAVTLKTVAGMGTLANVNNELKPQITNTTYTVVIESGSKAEAMFTTSKLKLFRVKAEREGQYGDLFNDKQQDKLSQAFTCVK